MRPGKERWLRLKKQRGPKTVLCQKDHGTQKGCLSPARDSWARTGDDGDGRTSAGGSRHSKGTPGAAPHRDARERSLVFHRSCRFLPVTRPSQVEAQTPRGMWQWPEARGGPSPSPLLQKAGCCPRVGTALPDCAPSQPREQTWPHIQDLRLSSHVSSDHHRGSESWKGEETRMNY